MNHGGLATSAPKEIFAAPVDVSGLIGGVEAREDRPAVVLKYAQTADGRIATASGDSKWISGEEERVVSHCLRARADAVMVGIGTVLRDDPQLTVRMVSGASPIRVILDSKLEVPLDARVLDRDAHTVVVTTGASDPEKRRVLESEGVGVRMVAQERSGVSLPETMRALRSMGIETLLVEGGASVITSLLRERLVDRLVVSISPLLIGRGTDAVGDLAVGRVDEGIRLKGQTVYGAGNDILIAWDVASSGPGAPGSD
jgi:3,4-dihydroxy 2-butanone 4-phosphate synthase/GTP cyclohydrolase II